MEWQPIETAPKGGSYFLAYTPSAKLRKIKLAKWGRIWSGHVAYIKYAIFDDHGARIEPTHWMPLPDPPKTD